MSKSNKNKHNTSNASKAADTVAVGAAALRPALRDEGIVSVQVGEDIDYSRDYDISDREFNPFALSLRSLTSNDITETVQRRKNKMGLFDIARLVVLAVCAVVFIYASYNVVQRMMSYSRASASYEEMQNFVYSGGEGLASGIMMTRSDPDQPSPEVLSLIGQDATDVITAQGSVFTRDQQRMLTQVERLHNDYKDVWGWIRFDSTKIDYPLVQGTDNDYYLHYTASKEKDYNGSIFLDCNNKLPLSDNRNATFYGHNMNDGSMFADVSKLRYNANKFYGSLITVYTADRCIYVYEPFSYYKTVDTDNYIKRNFPDEHSWLAFLQARQAMSMYANDIVLTANDRIITLSTCTNNAAGDGRWVLHARLVKVLSDDPTKAFDITK